MTTTNKKPKINRVKAKKQLKLLRKRTLLLRKKAIRRYRLRCLKTADSLVLRARDTRAPSALRYARQLTAMHRARRFNRYLYLRGKVSAVRAAASAPAGRYFPPVNRAAKRRVSQNASAFRALQCARVQALLVSRYRRRVRTAFRPAKNLFPLLAQRKATTTRGARQLRKRLYRKLRPFRSQLLARRAATFSQGKARRGLRLRNTRGRAFSVRFSKQLTSATAEGRAKQLLLFAATEATPLNELESPAQPRTPLRGRQERKQTYALAKKRLVHSAKLFAIYRRTPGKLKYLVRRVRKIRRFFSVRRTTKASLRDRFFARTSLSSRTLTRRVLPLPKVVSTQTYATSYLTRSGARRTLQL
jgi:hypothetical protein